MDSLSGERGVVRPRAGSGVHSGFGGNYSEEA
jgi:hypothetical protein